jgi:hypothetical protein
MVAGYLPFLFFYFLWRFLRSVFCAGTFLNFKKRHIYFGSWPPSSFSSIFFLPCRPGAGFSIAWKQTYYGGKSLFPGWEATGIQG